MNPSRLKRHRTDMHGTSRHVNKMQQRYQWDSATSWVYIKNTAVYTHPGICHIVIRVNYITDICVPYCDDYPAQYMQRREDGKRLTIS